jgi:hypothetical protein
MAYQETVQKVLTFLTQLRAALETPKDFNLKSVCDFNNIPNEYAKFCVDNGYIIKVSGGKRGRAKYQWNQGAAPNEEMATVLVERFNELRRIQTEERSVNKKGSQSKNTEVLSDIFSSLELIRQLLERIAENTTSYVLTGEPVNFEEL